MERLLAHDHVGLHDRRSAEQEHEVLSGRREDLAKDHAAALPEAIGVRIDLTEPSSADSAVAQARSAFGQIDVLVLNAGGPPPGSAAELSPEDMASSPQRSASAP